MWVTLLYVNELNQADATPPAKLSPADGGYVLAEMPEVVFARGGAVQLRGLAPPGVEVGLASADAVVGFVAETQAECLTFLAGYIVGATSARWCEAARRIRPPLNFN